VKLLILLLIGSSLNAFACWRVTGFLTVNQESLAIDQIIDHDKTYSFHKGKYLFHLKMPSVFSLPEDLKDKKDRHLVEVNIQEKKGTRLSKVTNSRMFVKIGIDANMVGSEGTSVTDFKIKVENI
jgi:hypothetical protein